MDSKQRQLSQLEKLVKQMEQQHDRAELDRTRLEEQLAKMRYQLQKSNQYVDILRSYLDTQQSKSSRYVSNGATQHTCKLRSKSISPRTFLRESSTYVKPVDSSKSCRKIRFDDSSDPQVSFSSVNQPYEKKLQKFCEFYQSLMRPADKSNDAVVDSTVDFNDYYQSGRGDKSTLQHDSGAMRNLPRLSRQQLSWNRTVPRQYNRE